MEARPSYDCAASTCLGQPRLNPADMQRWNRSLLNAALLSTASLLEMFAVPALASGAQSHYASGWFIEPGGAIWHGGPLAGYGTANLIVPLLAMRSRF
jgi:hypothetical protein